MKKFKTNYLHVMGMFLLGLIIIMLLSNCSPVQNDWHLTGITGTIPEELYGKWKYNNLEISFDDYRNYGAKRGDLYLFTDGIYYPFRDDTLLLDYNSWPDYENVVEYTHYKIISIDSLNFKGVVWGRKY